jgi:NADH-quinone oxidoreductase subunit L
MTVEIERLLWLIPALPLAGFLVNAAVGKRLTERFSGVIGCAGPAASLVLSLWAFSAVRPEAPVLQNLWTWMSAGYFSVDIGLRVDALSGVMLLVVSGVGTIIHVYSIGYMKGDAGFSRYFSYLNLFMFSMLVLVLADNLVVMFVGWEGVGLCSYLLIGFWFEDLKNADAGKKAFVVNRVGDFGFLLGILLLLGVFGTVSFSGMAGDVQKVDAALLAAPAALLFLGACGKSAQIPLHVWLPDAMAGPTPVSALIHAATMVTAGVYMIARLGFIYVRVPEIADLIAVVAAATAVMAALTACAQTDIKKVLAYSTVSQLGFMFAGMASLQFQTGIFHLVTHSFFKALLFLGAGAVIHALHGEQDIRKMGGLSRDLRVVFVTFAVGAAALAGLWPASGFFSKDAILTAVYERMEEGGVMWMVWPALLATAFLTAFYSARLLAVVFLVKRNGEGEEGEGHELHRPGWVMLGPLCVLAVLSLVGGALHHWFDSHLATGWSPAPEAHPSAQRINMLVSMAVAFSGFGLAIVMYGFRKDWLDRALTSDTVRALQRLGTRKFYFDEIYHWTIVTGLKTGAAALWFVVDRLLIDRLLVDGAGWVAYRAAGALKRVHTGVVSVAAGAMAVGTAALLWYLVFRVLNHG